MLSLMAQILDVLRLPPCNTAALVALSSLLFYAAEREYNSKVNDEFDAEVYCSTCLSVGYDIFAKKPPSAISSAPS
jgi:hypothetical protein